MARPDMEEIHNLFDRTHDRFFGYCLPHESLDLVNLRATCIGRLAKPETQRSQVTYEDSLLPRKLRRAYVPGRQRFEESPVYGGEDFVPGVTVEGPAIVELPQTTIMVPTDFSIHCDSHENFVLTNLSGERGEKGAADI
jgi:N-methylhydantoinase A/oxoprolinase/acetone carboxylase beta subunit